MNNLGYSKDNVFIGDVRVKGQDETVIIGNENGGPGYILPEQKGTVGQVITMNADNSTSFQDVGGITGRLVNNLFVMQERTNFYNTLPTSAQALFQTGYGTNTVDIANFPVNSTIHIYSRGVIDFDASVVSSGTGVFQLEVDDGAGSVAYYTSNNLTLSKQGTANQNRFYQVDYIFQRTGTNSYKFNGYGLVSDGSNGQIKMGFTEQTIVPTVAYTQFTIKATYYKIVSTPGEEYIPLAAVYINNLIVDSSLIISPPPAPTSHTSLTDSTAGDAGHTQFAQLNGRVGGQVLSGGTLPIHDLILKSHDIGLPNINIKDLNTEFKKNIDLDNNSILNINTSNTQQAQIELIVKPTVGQLPITATNGVLITENNLAGGEIFESNSTESKSYKNLNMNNNQIDNVSSINGLTPVGGLFSGTSDSLNVAATTTETSILPLTFAGSGFGVPPNGFSVGDCFLLNLSGPFNSNNNDTLTIRLKGGPAATTLLATLVVPLNASAASVFELNVLFQIRAIGAAGVADIVSDAVLTYNQSGAGGSFVGEQSLSQNNTTFDTTVANVLDATAQFSSTSVNNDMTTRVSKLQKTF